MTYGDNRAWADQWLPAAMRTIGPRLLEPTSFIVDTEQATDLRLLHARDMRIAVRVRRPGHLDRYGWEVTLRLKARNGAKTEWDKITAGWADWFFYAHASDRPDVFARWFLIDLAGIRKAAIDGDLVCRDKPNTDGTAFRAIDILSLPRSAVIASSCPVPFRVEQREMAF